MINILRNLIKKTVVQIANSDTVKSDTEISKTFKKPQASHLQKQLSILILHGSETRKLPTVTEVTRQNFARNPQRKRGRGNHK